MQVGLPSMGQQGQVVAIKGKRVTVQLENLRTTVKVEELRLPPPEPTPAKKKVPLAKPLLDYGSKARTHFGDNPKQVRSGVDNSIDLVGERADVACERMEDFLADALGRDVDVVLLRHGHGSGALRKALRQRMSALKHVRKYRAGISAEGGDAVTVVWLDT
jgi:DNA mismatch repair protein MutS2